jgi:hypothetical protein
MRVTLKALFERYTDSAVVLKSTQYAKWTLPQLVAEFTDLGSGQTVVLERDFQEIGALLVNNLGAKLAGLLFPTSRPFYRIKPSAAIKQKAKDKGVSDSDLQSGLSRLELESCQQLFINSSYEQLVQSVKHLIVTGNVLLYRDSKTKKTLAYGISQFAVRRDGRGNMLHCILREYTDFESLEPEIQAAVNARNRGRYKPENAGNNRVELYTSIKREFAVVGGVPTDTVIYRISQEVDGIAVGREGTYPEHLCPWQAVCWTLVPGENYGRGLVEDYAGGFAKLSDSSHAATLYAIEIMKVVNCVQPGGGADIDEMQNAETGEYVQCAKDSIFAHEAGDSKKLEQMEASIETTFGRLARAFMYKGNTRDAERVTAFELKQDALEAETTLGGVYSSLSASMQVPLAHTLLTEVEPGMMEGIVTAQIKLDIVAGIPALGRQADVQNLAAAAQDAAAIIPVLTQVDDRVDGHKVFDMIMAGASVDVSMLYKDEGVIQAEREAKAQELKGQEQIATATTLQDQANQLGAIQT